MVVGFGTSVPELLVSGIAAAQGNLDLGVGNVVGSNVANISRWCWRCGLSRADTRDATRVLNREAPFHCCHVLLFAYSHSGRTSGMGRRCSVVRSGRGICWIIFGGHEESFKILPVDENCDVRKKSDADTGADWWERSLEHNWCCGVPKRRQPGLDCRMASLGIRLLPLELPAGIGDHNYGPQNAKPN